MITKTKDSRPQLCHLHTAVLFCRSVPVLPNSILELGRCDNDFGKDDARCGLKRLHTDVDAGIQAKDKTVILLVEDQITTRQQDLARCRDGDWGLTHVFELALYVSRLPARCKVQGASMMCGPKRRVDVAGLSVEFCQTV